MWRKAKDRARKQGTAFTISVDDVRAVWPSNGRCPVLGIALARAEGRLNDGSPSLDRLNAAWGYEPGNIAVISNKANRAKNNLRASELEKIVRWMRQNGLD
jgi:hypothetical protein